MDVASKRVLITGAASGIGRAVATAAGKAGAQLVLTDRNAELLAKTAAELTAAGADVAVAQAADVSELAQVQALADAVPAHGGGVDIVRTAPGTAAWGPAARLEHRHWQAMVDVNLMGPIHVIECFLPPMIAAHRGG